MAGKGVVAIIDWGVASSLKENVRFLERAGAAGRVKPRDWNSRSLKRRSLTLREDGSCEVQSFSTAAMVRRLNGVIVTRAARKVRTSQRG